ncbi:MAG: efflux RND transporter periplasmic adaptor subunit [Proteobacteria bacterium]|nr:efflux RND transporter periplasmic adaptor subunit [Pseudomonadota bacterium]
MKRSTTVITWTVAVALLVGVPVALHYRRGSDAKPVDTDLVAARVLSPTILASGSLTYQSEIKLVSEIIGRVTKVLVKEGDSVTRGQLLLQLDPASSEAEVAQLTALQQQSRLNIERQTVNVTTLDAKWQRFDALRAQGLVAASTFEEVAQARDVARVELATTNQVLRQTTAQLQQARERMAKTQLRAPIDGKVTALIIKPGETAVPSVTSIAGSDLMTVADTSSLFAEVNVNETDVARVGVGQSARIVPAAFPDKAWQGVVETVASSPRSVAGQSKSYAVRIRLTETAGLPFRTGMSCRAEIATRGTDAAAVLTVPVQAVHYSETTGRDEKSAASLFVVSGGKVAERSIETGLADDLYVEVTKGAAAGDQIVTGPARTLRFLRDGDRVTPTAAAKP